jgi:hypothetical protein
MAFPTATYTQADITVFEPNVWGERVNDFLKKKLVLANFFVNRSDEIAGGGKTLETPNLTEMGANAKSNGAAVTLNSPTETKITLTINQWQEVSFAIEDQEAAQVKKSYYLQEKLAKNAAYTIASVLDAQLAGLFSGFSNVVGVSTLGIADSDIRKAIGIYEGANNDPEDGAFFIDKKVAWNSLMGIDKFTLAINSPTMDVVNKGLMGKLYGYDVYTSNNLKFISGGTTGKFNALASKDALHWAAAPLGVMSEGGMTGSMGVRVQTNYIPDYLSTLTTADILFGVIENRDAAGVLIKTKAY